jgi:hypothetical protein
VIAKSEVTTLSSEDEQESLIDALLQEIDSICQGTEALEMISDRGLFLTCLLMRITRGRDNEIIAKLFTIMLTRAQNFIMMKCYLEDQKD